MALSNVARVLAGFALFFAAVEAIPLALALRETGAGGEVDSARGFLVGIGAALAAAAALALIGRRRHGAFFRAEGIATVGLAWCLASLLGAVPLWSSAALPQLPDALFESVSGLTTCGSSVLGASRTPAIESLPDSVLLWRSLLQWLGGLGIILVFLVVLPGMGMTGKTLLLSEQTGVVGGAVLPRMHTHARRLFRLYIALTLVLTVALGIAGLPWLDAACHAMTTLSTGGYSVRNVSVGAYHSVAAEVLIAAFMFVGGCNFALLADAIARPRTLFAVLLRNTELRVYLGIALGAIGLVAAGLWAWGGVLPDAALGITRDYGDSGRCLRDASFQVLTILSTTGFCSADFQSWPPPILLLLSLLMIIGPSTGSTGGGIKVLRLIVCSKLAAYASYLFVQPRRVLRLRVGSDVVPGATVSAVVALVLAWLMLLAAGTFVLSCDARLDLLSAFTANATCMSCCGPAITSVVHGAEGWEIANAGGINLGPYGSFGDLAGWSKLWLCAQMLLGRLELFAMIALLCPGLWRK